MTKLKLNLKVQTIPEDLYQYLISLLDSNGYFKTTPFLASYSEKQLQQAIYILQRTEPYGCFCRNLKESLKVQCELSENPASETGTILCDFLEELASHNYDEIIHKTELTLDELEEGFHFIQPLSLRQTILQMRPSYKQKSKLYMMMNFILNGSTRTIPFNLMI